MEKIDFKKETKKIIESCIVDIKKLVNINSENDPSTVSENDPFGKGVSSALKAFFDIADRDGFTATIYDNKICEVIIGDEGKDVTILGHVDVVPAVGCWTNDPYQMSIHDGALFGRGVSDDKGPLIASYYAAKHLYELGLLKGFHIRILAGGNEEMGSRGVEHYFNELKKPQPTIGFTPDSDFPCVFAEKAITGFDATCEIDIPHVISVKGGVAYNAVIERCELVTDSNELATFLASLNPNNIVERKDGLIHFTSIGKAAHGSTPSLGINAGLNILKSLSAYTHDPKLKAIVDAYSDYHGKGIDADFKSKFMGDCSLCIGIISYENKKLKLGCNYRFVDGVEYDEVIKRVTKASPIDVKFFGCSPLLFNDPETSDLIKSLVKAYQEETGDMETKPFAIGGGTYAKEAKNIVAFGMQFPGINTKMHDADEFLRLCDLENGIAIYMNAILKLGDLIK